MKPDYYDTLGVAKNASADDLKKAFRKKAMDCHPDRHPGDKQAETRFKELNEAYAVLQDADKRAAYDRYGHAAFEQGGGAGGFNFDFGGGGFADIFEEMFGDILGGGGGRRGQQGRGADLRYDLDLTLEEAFSGTEKTIKIASSAACEDCKGQGAKAGSAPVTCPMCQGHGRMRVQQGFFTIERACVSCQGAGKIIKDPCRGCQGSGRVRKEKKLAVTVPAGVEDGTRIRLSGEGEAGLRGSTAGDLYVMCGIKPHALFHREGANLLCRVPLAMTIATLGGSIDVPTIDGPMQEIKIEAGMQSGTQMRLKNKGMTILNQRRSGPPQRGDLYIELQVETPRNLNAKQRELLESFQAESHKHNPFVAVGDFMERIKKAAKH